ncbi:hypothetical protein F9Y90_00445 [Borrelia miyamotoi]|nr:hypothetical protein F9Y90_00445 [Borrelia miyamotoi]QGT55504.1 hypothetical protein GNY89_00450 [Borrelia miyamotoi]QGT56285.1 hypothetical protein GNY88_00450 [Borrelia miyamotoi]
MVLSLILLQLDLNLKNLFLSFLVFSCDSVKSDFSILEFSVINSIALNSLVDIAYNMILPDFDLVIIKNMSNKEELDLINNKVSFGSFENAYFIRQNNISSISILAKEDIKIQVLDFVKGFYQYRLGVLIDFIFKDYQYAIVIFNFDETIADDLDVSIIDEQVTYLSYRYDNLLFILDKYELSILDILIKNGFFSLIYDSINPIHIINTIDNRVYSKFSAQISLHSLVYVILSYLHNNFYIDSFPKSILIK